MAMTEKERELLTKIVGVMVMAGAGSFVSKEVAQELLTELQAVNDAGDKRDKVLREMNEKAEKFRNHGLPE